MTTSVPVRDRATTPAGTTTVCRHCHSDIVEAAICYVAVDPFNPAEAGYCPDGPFHWHDPYPTDNVLRLFPSTRAVTG